MGTIARTVHTTGSLDTKTATNSRYTGILIILVGLIIIGVIGVLFIIRTSQQSILPHRAGFVSTVQRVGCVLCTPNMSVSVAIHDLSTLAAAELTARLRRNKDNCAKLSVFRLTQAAHLTPAAIRTPTRWNNKGRRHLHIQRSKSQKTIFTI
eukprot:m.409969 g.409969  ORF g.409969 m.409969 type:complete len:152 (-) comp16805_c0_seq2:189-644(-)